MNLAHEGLAPLHDAVGRPLEFIALAVSETTGWLDAGLALLLRVFGRSPEVLRAVDLGWLVLLLLGVGRAARQLGGPVAAFVAVALCAGMPGVVIQARIGWIHVPEAALVFAAAAVWLGDRELTRRRTAVVLALCGGLALALRPSGAAWVGTLGLAVAWSTRRWRVLGAVAAVWLLASLPALSELPEYLRAKALARDRYSLAVPDLQHQLLAVLGALSSVGALVGLLPWLRRWRPTPARAWLAAWIVLPLGLVALFQAGLDNHTVFGPALAIAAGCGVAGVERTGLRRALAALSVPGALLLQVPLVAPASLEDSGVSFLPGFGSFMDQEDINAFVRPYEVFGRQEVRGLLEATCAGAEPGGCRILVDQGLFYPFVEDVGELELFLLGEERVDLVPLWEARLPDLAPRPHAMATYDCASGDDLWRQRHPSTVEAWRHLTQEHRLEPAWARKVSRACTFIWLAPQGTLVAPEALPHWNPPPRGGPPPAQRRSRPGDRAPAGRR